MLNLNPSGPGRRDNEEVRAEVRAEVRERENDRGENSEDVLDMSGIFLQGASSALRRLLLIVESLKLCGLPNIRVKFETLKLCPLQGKVICIHVLKFSVLACGRTFQRAAVEAAEMLLFLMGFSKPQCLISVAARRRALENSTGSGSVAGEFEEVANMTEIFKKVRHATKRLGKIVHAMQAGDPNLSVNYETHELQSRPHLKYVKCTVGEYCTIADGRTVEFATRSASMLMLLKLGFFRQKCFLSARLRRNLKMIHDVDARRLNRARRRLVF